MSIAIGAIVFLALLHAMESDRQKALAAGCSDYMAKPFERSKFVEICAKAIVGSHN